MFITDAVFGCLIFSIVEGSKFHRKSVYSNIVCHVACVGEIKNKKNTEASSSGVSAPSTFNCKFLKNVVLVCTYKGTSINYLHNNKIINKTITNLEINKNGAMAQTGIQHSNFDISIQS